MARHSAVSRGARRLRSTLTGAIAPVVFLPAVDSGFVNGSDDDMLLDNRGVARLRPAEPDGAEFDFGEAIRLDPAFVAPL